jgi:hypothetical protein
MWPRILCCVICACQLAQFRAVWLGEGVSVEAYHPASRRGHLKDDDADEGIGLFQVHAMGWRLFPGREPDSPRNR